MALIPRYVQAECATADTLNATADAVVKVPTGATWMFDLMTIKVVDAQSVDNNEVTIFVDGTTVTTALTCTPATDTDGSDQIWELLEDVVGERAIDLASRYPRSLQAATNITARVKKLGASSTGTVTITLKVWVLEVS